MNASPTQILTVRLPIPMVEALTRIAVETDIPRARLIRLAVKDSIQRHNSRLDQDHRELYQ
jgi:predicted transcriptional regulator